MTRAEVAREGDIPDGDPEMRNRPWLWRIEAIAITAIALALAMWRFGGTVADPDLWGHVRFGIDKINAGAYIAEDTYSYLTEGRVWFNHEWLAEVVMGAVYLQAGSAGLVLLKGLLAASLVVFLSWWLIRSSIPPVRVGILMAVCVMLLTPTLGTFRPQVFTTVLFTATLALIVGYSRDRTRLIWLLPAMFALWVNLHGGVLSGMAVVWLWAVLWLVFRRERAWEPTLVAGTTTVALLLNPHGLDHIRFLLETTTVGRPEIVEWSSLELLSALGIGYAALVILLSIGMIRSRRDLDPTIVVPLLGLMVAPLVAWRHLQLFVPAVVVLGGAFFSAALGSDGVPRRPRAAVAAALVAITIVASLFSVVRSVQATDCLVLDSSQFDYPARAVQALAAEGVTGNAVVTFNWGEYIIWHLGPDLQVSIDGRRETIYSEEALSANLDFANGVGDWSRVLDLGRTDLVIQVTRTPGAVLMASEPGWRLIYEDSSASVFAPDSSTLELRGDRAIPADGDGICFGEQDLRS